MAEGLNSERHARGAGAASGVAPIAPIESVGRVGAALCAVFTPDRVRAYAPLSAGLMLAGALASLAAGGGWRDLSGSPVGADWIAFYTGGTLALAGDGLRLMDPAAQEAVQRAALPVPVRGPNLWLAPPWTALALAPYAAMGFVGGLVAWTATSLALLGLAVRRVARHLAPDASARGLWWAALSFFPVIAALTYGQLTMLWLAACAALFVALDEGDDHTAAAALTALALKPHLWALAAWLVVARGRWRVAAGSAVGVAALVALTEAALPGATADWAAHTGLAWATVQDPTYPRWGLLSVTAVVMGALGAGSPLVPATALAAGATLALGAGGLARRAGALGAAGEVAAAGRAWAAAWAVALFAAPHLFLYDAALLGLAIAWSWRGSPASARWEPALRAPALALGLMAVPLPQLRMAATAAGLGAPAEGLLTALCTAAPVALAARWLAGPAVLAGDAR